MNGEHAQQDTPLAQSIIANIQLDLPGTVSRLAAKLRFIEKVAPMFKQAGIVRTLNPINPLSMHASGISSSNKTTFAFGGILYIAGAVRQDILIEKGSIFKTIQQSTVKIDEIDDLDTQKLLKFVDMMNVYELLQEVLESRETPDLIMVDVPLLLEHSDVPLMERRDVIRLYQQCKEVIKEFWQFYKERIYPFDPDGVKLVSVGTKRFGAIIFVLEGDNIRYIPDPLDHNTITQLGSAESMTKLKGVGIKRLLYGVLGKGARTAAYQFDGISPRNRLEPEELRESGLINMHVKAGYNTAPLLLEMLGTVNDWTPPMLDSVAEHIISLIPFDQEKALPLPLWYAGHSLQPITKGDVLRYYKAQSREMLKQEALDNIWKADFDIFEE